MLSSAPRRALGCHLTCPKEDAQPPQLLIYPKGPFISSLFFGFHFSNPFNNRPLHLLSSPVDRGELRDEGGVKGVEGESSVDRRERSATVSQASDAEIQLLSCRMRFCKTYYDNSVIRL